MINEFFIDKYLAEGDDGDVSFQTNAMAHRLPVKSNTFPYSNEKKLKRFNEVCSMVKAMLDQEFKDSSEARKAHENELQKNAIIGIDSAVKQLTDNILNALTKMNLLSEPYPEYYRNLQNAVFNELYGLSILAPWVNDYFPDYEKSSSAKIIGSKLYVMIDGVMKEQPMRISIERRDQLIRALLMAFPKQSISDYHNEVFVLREKNGTHVRATLLHGEITYEGEDCMVFRKYLFDDSKTLTFENLAEYGTFPVDCCGLFEDMVKIGFNVFMVGPVRSGKTTFLNTWQHYEDPSLEATTISSDEETNYKKITDGPLVQIVVDSDKKLDRIEKSLKRLDSNYVCLTEVRDPAQYRFYLGITNMGTRRCKCTIHDNSATNFPYKMATEITTEYGGNQQATIAQLYSNIDYAFEFFEVPNDRSRKKLKAITELRYDPVKDICSAHQICKYDAKTDTWKWKYDIGIDKEMIAMGVDDAFQDMKRRLKDLENDNPLLEKTVVFPAYYDGNNKKDAALTRIANSAEELVSFIKQRFPL